MYCKRVLVLAVLCLSRCLAKYRYGGYVTRKIPFFCFLAGPAKEVGEIVPQASQLMFCARSRLRISLKAEFPEQLGLDITYTAENEGCRILSSIWEHVEALKERL